MLIWIVMAVILVIIVAGGFVGRSRQTRRREQNQRNPTHKTTHHGKDAHRSRGRGRSH